MQRELVEIDAAEAERRFDDLLDSVVSRGSVVAITRDGKRIARIVSEESEREREIRLAMRQIEELRKQNKPATREEILSWRDEGRK
jgi:prevent-host-death family protein